MKRELTDEEVRQAVERIEQRLIQWGEELYELGLAWVSLGLDQDEFWEKVRAGVKAIEARLLNFETERSKTCQP